MTEKRPYTLRSDRPIESKDEDRFGRAPFVRAIAEQILGSPAVDSYVVALMGPWGCGKTSLVNMVAEEVRLRSENAVVLYFNPWIFSGAEQLVGHFFHELGSQLTELKQDKLSTVGAAINKYASLFGQFAGYIPGAGAGLKIAADATAAVTGLISDPPSIEKQRKAIQEALRGMDQRIVVLIDDIDRLRREEIREIVKLVRLTGDFPNVVYVLAFDRERVERALSDDDESGRAYLEKIIQVGYDVPVAQATDINELLLSELDAALSGLEHGYYGTREWANVFVRVIRPLFRSARDVRRYVNAIPPTVQIIGPEVALVDLLALEAIRVFLPDVFAQLPARATALTASHPSWHSGKDPHGDEIRTFVDKSANKVVVSQMIHQLFPMAQRHIGGPTYSERFAQNWRKQRRVAVPEVLRFYLERRLPEGAITTAEVDNAFKLLGDRSALHSALEKLDPVRVEALLARLEAYEDDFTPDKVESAVGALLDQMHRLRVGKNHFFDLGAGLALDRVILRLIRCIQDQSERERIVSTVLPTLKWWSAMRALVVIMEGHELASKEMLQQWKEDLYGLVLEGDIDHLLQERSLGILLIDAIKAGGGTAVRARALLSNTRVFIRLLTSMAGAQSSWTMGDVVSSQELRLPWDFLEDELGEELASGIDNIASAQPQIEMEQYDRQVYDLARKYRDGWRPDDGFGGRRAIAADPASVTDSAENGTEVRNDIEEDAHGNYTTDEEDSDEDDGDDDDVDDDRQQVSDGSAPDVDGKEE
ncbi:P-loop NTPase fold protein [Sorangium sp. So ce260]|uniref:KAP family P-loop NTPase fold protein n=1 Tax=Sorangium sp. So ce260 TaxID=3133291 RepID=UPI003F5E95D0